MRHISIYDTILFYCYKEISFNFRLEIAMNKYRLVNDLAVLGLSMLLPVAAQAQASQQLQEQTNSQQSGQPGEQLQRLSFAQLDRNGDGELSEDEAQRLFSKKQDFSDADVDGDGQLSKQEFEKAMKESTVSQANSTSDEMKQREEAEKAQPMVRSEKAEQSEKTATAESQQEQAEVAVSQPAPKVIVEQPQPKVIVKQPEPEVTIKQEEPEVTLRQPEQPEVIVEQAKKAEVEVIQGTSVAPQPTNSLYKMSVGDVLGKDIVTADGETVGEVERVVLHSGDKRPYVVFSAGGFLGLGDKEVVVPVSELELQHDRIAVTTAASEDQLEQQPAYNAADYTVLEERHTIGEFAETEPTR